MPYGVRKSGDNFKVVNKETGRVFGTHSTKEKANKQLAALYINANPKNESAMLDVRVVTEKGIRPGSLDILAEAVRKDNLIKAASILSIDPLQLLEFIKSVDTDPDLPHGNWICMAAAKGMPVDKKTGDQLRMMLNFFTKYKKQVTNAGKSANIFEYPDYPAFKDMVFSFGKHAYDYNPEELPGVSKTLESGPFAVYKVTAENIDTNDFKNPELQQILTSLGRMGIGTRWCTRSEGYGPSWRQNAMNYLVLGNPNKTMFIITKFNNPYIQLQKDLAYIMDTEDKPFDTSNPKLRRELSEVFAKMAGELDLSKDSAKSKYLSLVGVRTRKAFDYYLANGYQEVLLLSKLTVPLTEMGFTQTESEDLIIKVVTEQIRKAIYDGPLIAALDNNPLLTSKTFARIHEEGLQVADKRYYDRFLMEYVDRVLTKVQGNVIKPAEILPLEPIIGDINSPEMLFRWCVFVRDARWPEKELIMKDVFDRDQRFAEIYYGLGKDISDEDEREKAVKALIKQFETLSKRFRTGTDINSVERALKNTIVTFVLTYGAAPEVTEYLEDLPANEFRQSVASSYHAAVRAYAVEEVE
jgi:hypothetical protein